MTRPNRNMLGFAAAVIAIVFGGPHLPPFAVWLFFAAFAAYFIVTVTVGREFFVGRRHTKHKRWEEAAICFVLFEKRLLTSQWRRSMSVVFSGMYTYDGVALARNNLGAVRLDQGRNDEAEAALLRSLERDPLYATPHANLAILAALKGDAPRAKEESEKARALGYRTRGLQKKIRSLLAGFNSAVGAGLDRSAQ